MIKELHAPYMIILRGLEMFRLITDGELKYYTATEFEKTGLVRHCFTTRCGGVSQGDFASMNIRINCDDSRENILENYRIICSAIGTDYKNAVLSHQVHEDNIEIVGKKDCGNGLLIPQKFESCDALITADACVPLFVFGADCVPVCFLDTERRVIAAAHSGWKGTVAEICAKTVLKMTAEFGTNANDLRVAIGPSIGVCHFEVGDDVAEIFKEKFGGSVLEKHEKYHVNMQEAIKIQLCKIGVPEKNIVNSGICTYCNNDLFFSHRRTGARRGVGAAVIELKDGM